MAATDCRICSEQIGYGDAFYHEGDQRARPFVLVHADCLEDEVEAQRRAAS